MTDLSIENFHVDKSDWSRVCFGDVVYEPKESVRDPASEGVTRVVGLEHIDSEDINLRRWSDIEEGTTFTKKFRKGDVLFGRRRSYLKKAALAGFDGVCSGDIIVLRAREGVVLPGLLPFFVNNDRFFDYAVTHSAGGLSPRVKFKDLRNLEILIPKIENQLAFLNLYESLEQAHETSRRTCSELNKFQKSYFENLIQTNLDDRATLREALVDIFAGKSPKGLSRPAEAGEHGVLKVSAVGDGKYIQSENKVLTNQSEFNPVYEVQKGFILVTRANALVSGVGRPCLVSSTRRGLMLSDKTLRLVPDTNMIRDRFLFQLLKSRNYRAYVESVAGGTEAKNISQKLIYGAPIWLPSLAVQDGAVSKLETLDAAIGQSELRIENIKNLKKTIDTQVVG